MYSFRRAWPLSVRGHGGEGKGEGGRGGQEEVKALTGVRHTVDACCDGGFPFFFPSFSSILEPKT